jgi:hypothetical protein
LPSAPPLEPPVDDDDDDDDEEEEEEDEIEDAPVFEPDNKRPKVDDGEPVPPAPPGWYYEYGVIVLRKK